MAHVGCTFSKDTLPFKDLFHASTKDLSYFHLKRNNNKSLQRLLQRNDKVTKYQIYIIHINLLETVRKFCYTIRRDMVVLAFAIVFISCVLNGIRAECPNACSSHGRCGSFDMCVCYRNWMSNDCSESKVKLSLYISELIIFCQEFALSDWRTLILRRVILMPLEVCCLVRIPLSFRIMTCIPMALRSNFPLRRTPEELVCIDIKNIILFIAFAYGCFLSS